MNSGREGLANDISDHDNIIHNGTCKVTISHYFN